MWLVLLVLRAAGFAAPRASSPSLVRRLSSAEQQDEQQCLFVCSNRWCRERGAAMALGASIALTAGENVDVKPHKCFGRCAVGPNVAALTSTGAVLEFHNVNTVEKVCHIAEHLGVAVDRQAARCLELNYQANKAFDEAKNPELGVLLYGASLETGYDDQAAVVLVGRAAARLELARRHREAALAKVSNFLSAAGRRVKLSPELLRARLLSLLVVSAPLASRVKLSYPPSRRRSFFGFLRPAKGAHVVDHATPAVGVALRVMADCQADSNELAAVDFEFNMHEIETRRALRDALDAAARLPSYSRCWRLAAAALSALPDRDLDAKRFSELADALDAKPDTPAFSDERTPEPLPPIDFGGATDTAASSSDSFDGPSPADLPDDLPTTSPEAPVPRPPPPSSGSPVAAPSMIA